MGHAFSLDDRLIRVPLVVAGPWSPPPDRLVSLVDLPRLLADAVGLDDHPWRDRTGEDVAVAQLDAPCAPDDPVAVEALDSLGLGLDALPRLVRSFTCATDGRLKLFRDGSSETIVDLEADPMEEEPEMVGRVHELRHGPALQRLRTALDEAAAVERNAGPGQLNMTIDDPELEKKMRLLGYL
jgi:hypothetical protein